MEQSDLVRLLYEELSKKHNVNVVRKDGKNWFSNLAGDVLEILKVQPSVVFREDMVTTITHPLDTTIHTPFEPGVEHPKWSLDNQEEVLSHELTHVFDARSMGSIEYDVKYLLSPARRAYAETLAREADVEYSKFRYGINADIAWLSDTLKLYACSNEVPFVAKSLDSVLTRVKQGGVRSQSVIEMLEIIRREDPSKIAWDPFK